MASVWVREDDNKKAETEEDNLEDIWDDSALIKAYDRAINSFKNKGKNNKDGQQQHQKNKQKKKKREKSNRTVISSEKDTQWQIGDKCQAVYYEDGLLYHGIIIDMDLENKSCTVKFDYYGNIETVGLDDLYDRQVSNYEGNKEVGNGKHTKNQQNYMVDHEWKIGDMCKAWNEKTMKNESAVITNISSQSCNLTFTETNSKQTVLLSSIRSANRRDESHHRTCDQHQRDFWSRTKNMFPNFSAPSYLPPPEFFFQMLAPPLFAPPYYGFPNFQDKRSSPWKNESMLPPPPPPPPLPFPSDIDDGNDDALASMLMSWYMVGYHTGFYQATKRETGRNDAKRNSDEMDESDIISDCSTKTDL